MNILTFVTISISRGTSQQDSNIAYERTLVDVITSLFVLVTFVYDDLRQNYLGVFSFIPTTVQSFTIKNENCVTRMIKYKWS